MPSKYQYKNGLYIAPDGKVFRSGGTSDGNLPNFGYNTIFTILEYMYRDGATEYPFTVDENGNLVSTLDGLDIDDQGNIIGGGGWTLLTDNVSEEMQRNIDLLRSHNKRINLKVSLLDENYMEVQNLTGRIKALSFEQTYDSDIRRTSTITLSVPAKEQIDLDFEKTWNNRMVALSCGLFSTETNNYIWYGLGNMLMASGETTFDATTQEVKLNLVDLMAALTPERGSQIGTPILIEEGSVVKDVIIAIITEFAPFKRYSVADFPDTIPYDITGDIGDYPIDLLNKVLELFPTYEMFYNTSGRFIVQEIPTKVEDPIDIGSNIIDDILISEKRSVDFSQVKNTTEIWGRQLSGDYVATSCETTGIRYDVTIDDTFTVLVDGETYTILPLTDSVSGQTMKIQDTAEYAIYTADGAGITYTPISAGAMKASVPYVIKYFEQKFVLQGELQVRCIVQEITEEPSQETKDAYMLANACNNVQWIVNPDSPFACRVSPVTGNILGEIKQVFDGGEFENIYSIELCYERAKYENWKACRLQDTKDVEMILVPWMDINQKIQYTSPVTGELETWIVQSISYEFTKWTMSVKVSRFYPYYPW